MQYEDLIASTLTRETFFGGALSQNWTAQWNLEKSLQQAVLKSTRESIQTGYTASAPGLQSEYTTIFNPLDCIEAAETIAKRVKAHALLEAVPEGNVEEVLEYLQELVDFNSRRLTALDPKPVQLVAGGTIKVREPLQFTIE